MKFRVQLLGVAALFVAGAAFAQLPLNNNQKLYQPDNNPLKTNNGQVIANPAAGSSFQVIYATAFNQGTESIKIMNTGSSGGVDGPGTICANVYVFDTAQVFQDCCYCKLSSNALGSVSLNNNFNLNAFSTAVIKVVATYPNNYQPITNKPTLNTDPNEGTPNTVQQPAATTFTCNPSVPATSADPTVFDTTHYAGYAQGTSFTPPGPAGQQWLAPGMAVWLDTTPFQASTHPEVEAHMSTLSMGEAANLAYQCQQKHGGGQTGTSTTVGICPGTCGI